LNIMGMTPPAFGNPGKRQKNYAADAEAICGAMQWPNSRFIPEQSPGQQAGLVLMARGTF
jgi:transposase